ncbi:MerR family transcriptional regulator [Arenibacter sp. 6A1]|uniref:MerR family transcriptional regulator n=1 Tax=Arenibacter sp. 6A1 TaxID=2720391 RepID=UPI001446CE3D|nr:MerR family transcriptional regulator [Arenibacter sp. 6A1]NKI27794.1 MerR family transcriptional regulator [Arenibacter sp. 6A1]
MNRVKKEFSIRDLENLSGIKAHTIRIWEKRYNLLSPERTSTNIRTYSITSLQKLLNITLLYNNGYKISKIAELSQKEFKDLIATITTSESTQDHAVASFKLAMMNFDQALFFKTLEQVSENRTFKEIFQDVFLPFLNEIGLLWQTDTISPSHEHFITHLIKHVIFVHTEKLNSNTDYDTDKTFVLFLPENEIHELGLLYLNYEINLSGYKTIYLGQSMPLENLVDLNKYFDNLYYISYFTVAPSKDKIDAYLTNFQNLIGQYNKRELWLLGQQTTHLEQANLPQGIRIFSTIDIAIKELNKLETVNL